MTPTKIALCCVFNEADYEFTRMACKSFTSLSWDDLVAPYIDAGIITMGKTCPLVNLEKIRGRGLGEIHNLPRCKIYTLSTICYYGSLG